MLVAGLALWIAHRRRLLPVDLAEYRLPLLTGLLLLVFGMAIYLPINAMAGRYTMPAVWGADICLAVLFSVLSTLPLPLWRRTAQALFMGALAAIAAINLGQQNKLAARNALLWEALECVEKETPPHGTVAWVGSQDSSGPNLELNQNERNSISRPTCGIEAEMISIDLAAGFPGNNRALSAIGRHVDPDWNFGPGRV